MTDSGIASLSGMNKLESLDLRGVALSDAGLAHVRKLTGLRSLFLVDTNATYEGVTELRGAVPHTDIISMNSHRFPWLNYTIYRPVKCPDDQLTVKPRCNR